MLLDLTKPKDPITIDCSALGLERYIKLINHYPTISDIHDQAFEKSLFADLTDRKLARLARGMAVLDSDFFFDAIADVVLGRIENLDREQMQRYFGFEDDFKPWERKLINNHSLEYLISLNIPKLNFPFPATNFLNLKNRFYCPLNVILARIIQRSEEKQALTLSMINKTLKNECDRHPIKLYEFRCNYQWWLIHTSHRSMTLSPKEFDETYFIAIKKRKVMVTRPASCGHAVLSFESRPNMPLHESLSLASSLEFVVGDAVKISFSGDLNQIYCFDVRKCPISLIFYDFSGHSGDQTFDFDDVYRQLIATDLSKQIRFVCFHKNFIGSSRARVKPDSHFFGSWF